MWQQILVIVLVGVCFVWMAWQGYRFFAPKAGGKACGGGCCDGEVKAAVKPASGERVVMISSDDMRNRIRAREGARKG